MAANSVFSTTGDAAAKIPVKADGTSYFAGALDFASSLFGWVIYKCVSSLRWIGAGVLTLITLALMLWNRKRIVADEKTATK
jgi:PTS system galactitol-specific IIC component